MIEHKIGTMYARTFGLIAHYFEFDLMDFKKADKIYRRGQSALKENEKEQKNITALYSAFSSRIKEKSDKEMEPVYKKVLKKEYKRRASRDAR